MRSAISGLFSLVLACGAAGAASDLRAVEGPRPNRTEPQADSASRRVNESAVAQRFAPLIFQETQRRERPVNWDIPTMVDFDGDQRANNNEESLRRRKDPLPAAVYYAVVETATHYFLTYSLYHPLDWSTLPERIPYAWHENDMESVQIVVRKNEASDRAVVILLAAQQHLTTTLYTTETSDIQSATCRLSRQALHLLDDAGRKDGERTAVFVESGGHGIYSTTDRWSAFRQLDPPEMKEGIILRPCRRPEDSALNGDARSYVLIPTEDVFWKAYLSGEGIGDGKLLDGAFNYSDESLSLPQLPRYFDSDRVSGPGKCDSGILPFAFGLCLTDRDLGCLFFHPANKYAASLVIGHEWSVRYVSHPYRFAPTRLLRTKMNESKN